MRYHASDLAAMEILESIEIKVVNENNYDKDILSLHGEEYTTMTSNCNLLTSRHITLASRK